jgi:hypothetical protein
VHVAYYLTIEIATTGIATVETGKVATFDYSLAHGVAMAQNPPCRSGPSKPGPEAETTGQPARKENERGETCIGAAAFTRPGSTFVASRLDYNQLTTAAFHRSLFD